MPTLDDAPRLFLPEFGLATLSLTRPDGTVQGTLVNAGVFAHPVTGAQVAGLVAVGGSKKIGFLRTTPRATITWRRGWSWITVEGSAELAGPDDPLPGVADLPGLLRAIFTGCGGTHDDWPTFDRVMAEERRCGVLVTPVRIYGNPG